jgi:hypothetical protein
MINKKKNFVNKYKVVHINFRQKSPSREEVSRIRQVVGRETGGGWEILNQRIHPEHWP